MDSALSPPKGPLQRSTTRWLADICNRTTNHSPLPLIWIFQSVFGISSVSWLSLSGAQVAAEIEERKFRARHLPKLHHILGRLVFVWIIMEMLRHSVLWFLVNFVDPQSRFFTYISSRTLFYVAYGFVIVVGILVLTEIVRYSYIGVLQVPLNILQTYQAEHLANTSMFSVARAQQEDPRDKFARNLRLRQSVKQEPDQLADLSFSQFSANDNNNYIRTPYSDNSPFQRQMSGGFGRSSPRRHMNDSLNKSLNRSFGSSHSSGSNTSSPSCLFAAVDWDPVDRDEIENFCGQAALDKLLAQEQLFEKQRLTMLEDESMNWSPQIQSLRDQNYQTSSSFHIPSPKKSKKTGTPDIDEPMERLTRLKGDDKVYPLEDLSWIQLKVSVETLHFWTENLRMWIADTVISPLLVRIDEVNRKLHERMHTENVVGESSTPDSLRQTADKHRQNIPELLQIIPFLDISMQQDYVIKRLKELVKDGILGDYSWNSGSSYGGQPWQDFLPTDAALVMHCFITFLDVILPPDPHAANWRSFSHRYVLRSLGSWKAEDPHKPSIHQAVSNPPKYEILYGGQLLQVAEGKNNVFHTILLFARLMQLREKNGQGYANLGPGRIIFRVFDTYK
ncbi:uncharacterized protein LOC129590806 [Paramacrobiotus metropolitanus]|uniref:uncharacterized protein LOC129590806 n=1 Tax=Paramacrobiotus metropolitanus TaxID=2943436 RepID=UPI0024457AEE|nr:uncharacterized protein LOC129590806 [Paramacrobiotus metropolitanus]